MFVFVFFAKMHLKMSSSEVVHCILLLKLLTNVIIETKSVKVIYFNILKALPTRYIYKISKLFVK